MTLEKEYLIELIANGVVELRCFEPSESKKRKVWSGFYDKYDTLRLVIGKAMRSGYDIYHTLNPLRIPASNGLLRPYCRAARDADVIGYKTLFIDLDSKGLDMDLIMDQAFRIVDYLDGHGFEVPTVGCSGNGVHIRYNINLPVESKEMIKGFTLALSKRFSTDDITVDRVVFNEARIARCLGTVNNKGGNKSYIKMLSNHLTESDVFMALAESIIPPKEKPKHFVKLESEKKCGKFIKNWDGVEAFIKAGLYLEETPEADKHWVTCVNAGAHGDTGPTDTVLWTGEWPQYSCSHDHCSAIGISDVITALEGI